MKVTTNESGRLQLQHAKLTATPSRFIKHKPYIIKTKLSSKISDQINSFYYPIIPLPTNNLGEPVRVENFLIWPELVGEQAYFTLETPILKDFTMTVQQEAQNNTVKISGANAVFILSVYAEEDLATFERYHDSWTTALKNAGRGARNWKYTPLHLRNLKATINIPQEHLKNAPNITVNSSIGTAIFMIELTELGAQVWKQALEAKQGNIIPGTCQLIVSYFAQVQSQLVSREQVLSSTIGNLGKELGTESYRVINSQLTGEAKVIVSGHQTIEKVVIELHSDEGQPVSEVMGPEGGQLIANVTAEDLSKVNIDWSAKVSYRSSGWPVVRDSGKLSFATNNSTVIVKPDIWVIEYTIICMLLDENGTVLANSLTSDLENRAQCDLTYSAPFLEGGSSLHSTFETNSQNMTTVTFPKPAGQPAGSLKLTLFAKRKAHDSLLTRMLQPDETLVIAKIDPNANISIITNKDPVNEQSMESEIFNLLADLG